MTSTTGRPPALPGQRQQALDPAQVGGVGGVQGGLGDEHDVDVGGEHLPLGVAGQAAPRRPADAAADEGGTAGQQRREFEAALGQPAQSRPVADAGQRDGVGGGGPPYGGAVVGLEGTLGGQHLGGAAVDAGHPGGQQAVGEIGGEGVVPTEAGQRYGRSEQVRSGQRGYTLCERGARGQESVRRAPGGRLTAGCSERPA
ncbi:hypothetical protein GCM10018953_69500 [Streptosporangium nondiastaticum]